MDKLIELGYTIEQIYEYEKIKIYIHKTTEKNKYAIFVIISANGHGVCYDRTETPPDNEMCEIMKYLKEEVKQWQNILKESLLINGLRS